MKILLRPYQLSDQLALATMANNPNIANNLKNNFPYPYTIEIAKKHLLCAIQADPEKLQEYAIEIDGKFAGAISVTFNQDIYCYCCEIGYWLGQPYWNKGIMKKSVKLIIDYIFKNYDINIIIAKTFTTNISSQKVLEANNFKKLIILKKYAYKNNQFHDLTIFELSRETYYNHKDK